MNKLKLFLTKHKIEYFENFNLASLSSIKIGERAKCVIFPKNTNELENILLFLTQKKYQFRVFGNASNVLFIKEINYPLVFTAKMQEEYVIKGNEVCFSAGMLLPIAGEILKRNALSGFEGLANIPASIGGAIKNGAGAFGYNIFDNLISIKALYNGKIIEIFRNEINFKHHYSNLNGVFILSAKFLFVKSNEYDIIKLLSKFSFLRLKSQPVGYSLGSVYQKCKQYSAGYFIERAGLKGLKVGGIEVSKKHANFFINDGSATATEFLMLAARVEAEVFSSFGVNLLTEIEKVGDINETYSRLSCSFK